MLYTRIDQKVEKNLTPSDCGAESCLKTCASKPVTCEIVLATTKPICFGMDRVGGTEGPWCGSIRNRF